MYIGITIIVYILVILHERYLFTLYPGGLIISPGADGGIYIYKLITPLFAKLKMLANSFFGICPICIIAFGFLNFPRSCRWIRYFFAICILKGLSCCIKQLPPAAALDLARRVSFLCAGKQHWEFFNQMNPSLFTGLYEHNGLMFLPSSAPVSIPNLPTTLPGSS